MAKQSHLIAFAILAGLALMNSAPGRAAAPANTSEKPVSATPSASPSQTPSPSSEQMALIRQYSPLQYCSGASYPVAAWQQIRDFRQKYALPAESSNSSNSTKGDAATFTNPSVVTAPAIEFPPMMLGTSETGSVSMLVAVADDGKMLDALVACSSHQAFSDAALASARATTFKPATRNGLPVADVVVMPFNFHP